METLVNILGPAIADLKSCEKLLRALPDYFGVEKAIIQYLKDIENLPVFTASQKNKTIGFLAIDRPPKTAAEIHLMGVLPEAHHQGIGSELINTATQHLKSEGVLLLKVKTLGKSHPDKNYAKTRKFYASQGFSPVKEIQDFWGKGLPVLFMEKKL